MPSSQQHPFFQVPPFPLVSRAFSRLAAWLELTPDEVHVRDAAIERVTKAVRSVFSGAHVEPFGSFKAGVSMFLSDVDIRVTLPSQHKVKTHTQRSE